MLVFNLIVIAATALVVAAGWALALLLRWGWWWGAIITVGAIIAAVAIILVRRWRATVAPGAAPEIAAFEQVWTRELNALGAHLAAVRSKPLYVVLGGPSGGKSGFLSRSGIPWLHGQLPGGGEPEATAAMRWWVSDSAVVLDTAGAWCSARRTPPAYTRMLSLLASLRGSAGVQGVIACVPLGDLLRKGPLGWSVEAQAIRDRIEELNAAMGTVPPLYLTFTKADQLGGFKDFFSFLPAADRERVLGVTFPWPASGDPVALWNDEHQRLVASLRDRRLHALLAARVEEAARKLVQLPVQFQALGPIIAEFAGHLVRPGEREHAPLRGVYFTSCLRPGTGPLPAQRIQSASIEGTGSIFLGAGRPQPADTAPDAGLFARDLLARLIFADRDLAGPTAARRRQQRRLRACLGYAVPIVAGCAAVYLAVIAARRADGAYDLRQAAGDVLSVERTQAADLPRNLEALDRLAVRLAVAARRADGALAPAVDAAAGLYARRMGALFLDRASTALATELARLRREGSADAADPLYDAFRAYRMLSGDVPVEAEPLERVLLHERRWYATLDAAGKADYTTEQVARRMLERHARELLPRRIGVIHADAALVDAVARDLGESLWIRQGYDEVMRGLKGQYPAVRGESLLGDGGRQALVVGHGFDGALTRTAWEEAVEPAFIEKSEALERTLTGLQLSRTRGELRRRLAERFAEDHRRNWLRLIASLQLPPIADPAQVPEAIDRVTGRGSPLPAFIKATLAELDLGGGIRLGFGEDTTWLVSCLESIATLRADVTAHLAACPPGRRAEVEPLLALAKRFASLSVACGERLAAVQPADKREAIHRGLDGILHGFWQPFDRAAVAELQERWRAQVVPPFQGAVAKRFPFVATATEDVSLAEFARLMNPVDGVLWQAMGPIERLREADVVGHPALTLAEGYLAMAARAAAIRDACFPGNVAQVQAPFTITLVQREGVRDLTIAVGSQLHRLYDRPDARYACVLRQGETAGAKIAIHVVTNEWKTLEFAGQDWGVLRLLRAGEPKPRPGGGWSCVWPFAGTSAGAQVTWRAAAVLEGDAFGRLVTGDLLGAFTVPDDLLPQAAAR